MGALLCACLHSCIGLACGLAASPGAGELEPLAPHPPATMVPPPKAPLPRRCRGHPFCVVVGASFLVAMCYWGCFLCRGGVAWCYGCCFLLRRFGVSRPVRIRPDVAARVELVADGERRSFANMVEVLLLAALTERGRDESASGTDPGTPGVRLRGTAVQAPDTPRSVSADRPVTHNRRHMRGDRPALECTSTDIPCSVCGAA